MRSDDSFITSKWEKWNKHLASRQFDREKFTGLIIIEKDKHIRNLIYDMVDHILSVSKPVKILLFGSRARGDAEPNSDIDLAVIFESKRECLSKKYYDMTNMLKEISPVDVDIKTMTVKYFKNNRENMAEMYYYMARDSIILYQRGNEDLYACLKRARDALYGMHISSTKNNSLPYVVIRMSLASTFLAGYRQIPANISNLCNLVEQLPVDWNIRNLCNKDELDSVIKNIKHASGARAVKDFTSSYATSKKLYESILTECIDRGLLLVDQIKELEVY